MYDFLTAIPRISLTAAFLLSVGCQPVYSKEVEEEKEIFLPEKAPIPTPNPYYGNIECNE